MLSKLLSPRQKQSLILRCLLNLNGASISLYIQHISSSFVPRIYWLILIKSCLRSVEYWLGSFDLTCSLDNLHLWLLLFILHLFQIRFNLINWLLPFINCANLFPQWFCIFYVNIATWQYFNSTVCLIPFALLSTIFLQPSHFLLDSFKFPYWILRLTLRHHFHNWFFPLSFLKIGVSIHSRNLPKRGRLWPSSSNCRSLSWPISNKLTILWLMNMKLTKCVKFMIKLIQFSGTYPIVMRTWMHFIDGRDFASRYPRKTLWLEVYCIGVSSLLQL